MSSFTDGFDTSDFDENIPFTKEVRQQMIESEPVKELSSSEDSKIIPARNDYPDRESNINFTNNANKSFLNISEIDMKQNERAQEKEGEKNIEHYKNDKQDFIADNNSTALKNNNQNINSMKKPEVNVVSKEEVNLSYIHSSTLSIPDENLEYKVEQVSQGSPETIHKEVSVAGSDILPTAEGRETMPKYRPAVQLGNKILSSKLSPLKTYDARVLTKKSPRSYKTKAMTANQVPSFFPEKFRMPKFVKDMIFGSPK